MPVVTGDFETYYSQEYSLRKMSMAHYILDPRYQTIMLSLKVDNGPITTAIGDREVARLLATIDWSRAVFLAHHTHFDGAILAWRYGIVPKVYACTLSMARAMINAVTGSVSLKAMSDYLGLPPKGDEVVRAMGKRLEDFTEAELHAYANYCARDTENTKLAFDAFLRAGFPKEEMRLIDWIVRMYTEPQVKLNPVKLAENIARVQAEKAAAFAKVAHIDKSVFSSNQKFAALLEQHGVEVPMKVSATTGEMIPALAKNDRAFKELCADDAQPMEVQALLAARIGAKSTIEETRSEALRSLSLLSWPSPPVEGMTTEEVKAAQYHGVLPDRGTGWMPVPMKYYGAHTGRPSGDGGFNFTNFKRTSPIRDAIEAPPGYVIVHRDSSQIEARMNAFLAGCIKLLNAFAQGRDIYSEFASEFYGEKITKADKPRRFVGKTSILGLGYGMGPPRFRHTLFIGNGGISVSIDEEEARRLVYFYRREYGEIPLLWQACEVLANRMIARRKLQTLPEMPQVIPAIEEGDDAIWLPNGMPITYHKLTKSRTVGPKGVVDSLGYTGPYGDFKYLFGGKITENLCQALARIVITDIGTRVHRETGYHPFMTTYDSLDYCVPDSDAAALDTLLDVEFRKRPAWAPLLPLASEGGWGPTLAAAEQENHPEHRHQ